MYLATVNSATAIPVSAARRLIRGAPYTRLGFPPLGDPNRVLRNPGKSTTGEISTQQPTSKMASFLTFSPLLGRTRVRDLAVKSLFQQPAKEQKRRPLMRPPLLFLQFNRSVRQC